MSPTITIFKNIKDTDTPFHRPVDDILQRIKEGKSKDLVKSIRQEKNKSKKNDLKQNLPAICFSGKFNKRRDSALVEHSGLICLDFDGYKKQKDLLSDKEAFTRDKFVYSVFISPSGQGLKVLIKIPGDSDNHTNYFTSLKTHFKSEYFDSTSKNISRVCYESYDPLIYINPNSSIWEVIEEKEYREVIAYKDTQTLPVTDKEKVIKILNKWFEKNYPLIEGQRNHNIYVLARAYNDYGIDESYAVMSCNKYASSGFPLSEIKRTIRSAYSKHEAQFNTKYFEDEDRINTIKQRLRRGESRKQIKEDLEDSDLPQEAVNTVLNRLEEQSKKFQFWTKNDKGVIKIDPRIFKKFLEDNGFHKYCPEGSKNYVFVKVTNNLIDHTNEKAIKDFVLDYLEELEDYGVYNYFAEQTRFFKEEFLTLLPTIEPFFIEDTKDTGYIYYKNCAVRITPNEIKPIDYIDLNGQIWMEHVIDRNYSIEKVKSCDYKTFIKNICNSDEQKILAMESTVGFLMHGYKDRGGCPAVILNDEVISDNPEGGTGKGIFMDAMSQMKKLVTIDGKAFTFERTFAYQLVSADTQILLFDDVKKYFDFERLFSVVTEGLTLEKKNKDAIKIPFSRSPKIAITTNYAIKGAGNSFARRKWELELHQYYNKNFTPQDEFKKLLFTDWDDAEWLLFDNYMISNLQYYLTNGLKESSFVNLKVRQLSAETAHDFIEWCGLIKGTQPNPELRVNEKLYKHALFTDFVQEYPDYDKHGKLKMSRNRFYKWLVAYGIYQFGVPPEESRDGQGRWLRYRNKHELEEQQSLEI